MKNNPFQRSTSALPLTLILLAGATLHAQQATVFSTGLSNPSKMILGPAGTLLVSAPEMEPDGPTGLLLDGNTLYVTIGEDDQLVNGTESRAPLFRGPHMRAYF